MRTNIDSDSEDDAQMQRFLEAADSSLLTNSMFQKESGGESQVEPTSDPPPNAQPNKSQRYLPDEDMNDNVRDLNFSEGVQTHIWKKIREILKKQVEFYEKEVLVETENFKSPKSKVRLLKGDDVFVKAYDEIIEVQPRQQVKPIINRRLIDNTPLNTESLCSLAVSGDDVLIGSDMKSWAKPREKQNKLFRYVSDKRGVLHAREPENEFTALRRNRNWHAGLIRQQRYKNTKTIKNT